MKIKSHFEERDEELSFSIWRKFEKRLPHFCHKYLRPRGSPPFFTGYSTEVVSWTRKKKLTTDTPRRTSEMGKNNAKLQAKLHHTMYSIPISKERVPQQMVPDLYLVQNSAIFEEI